VAKDDMREGLVGGRRQVSRILAWFRPPVAQDAVSNEATAGQRERQTGNKQQSYELGAV
jgi:hypothetical protein